MKRFFVTVRSEVAKVMFLHLSVCPQMGSASVHAGISPPPPAKEQTPPEQAPPGAGTPLEQTPPWEQTPPGSRHPPQEQTPPPQQTATVADGTHPTGMHSCWYDILTTTMKFISLPDYQDPE